MMKRRIVSFLLVLFSLPFLLSLDSGSYHTNVYAKFRSPEGIHFLSYSSNWNDEKLHALYEELLKNKHGNEIQYLQEIRIEDGPLGSFPSSDYFTKGRFNSLTNTITLYHGNKYNESISYRETLSHEYGHHVAYYYLKSHHFPFSQWSEIRGLEGHSINWNAFWNYTNSSHKWYPQEIFADDYVLLYGPADDMLNEDIFEAFYLQTKHENQVLPNVLENKQLHDYLESVTGLKVDENRLLSKPTITSVDDNSIRFSIPKKEYVAYKLNLTFYEKTNNSYIETDPVVTEIITGNSSGEIEYPVYGLKNGYVKGFLEVVDLNTSFGLESELFCFGITNEHLKNTCPIPLNQK